MDQAVDAINQLPEIHQHNATHSTERPLCAQDKLNEFKYLLLSHLKPHKDRITEESIAQYFQSLVMYEAIEFWQTLLITPEFTLKKFGNLFPQSVR